MKTFLAIIGVIFLLSVVFIGIPLASSTCWFANRAVDVIKGEIDPVVLQQKYEWFKDCKAALDAKAASLRVYEGREQSLVSSYGALPRSQWSKSDQQQWNQWESEYSGITSSYNSLAGEYNSQMSKWNWRFCNVGGLPQGATEVLPREYTPYIIK